MLRSGDAADLSASARHATMKRTPRDARKGVVVCAHDQRGMVCGMVGVFVSVLEVGLA